VEDYIGAIIGTTGELSPREVSCLYSVLPSQFDNSFLASFSISTVTSPRYQTASLSRCLYSWTTTLHNVDALRLVLYRGNRRPAECTLQPLSPLT